jgi:FAD dependent oxidoreductase
VQLDYDILVVGGSFGGCAAALAAATDGHSVCLIESSGWLGGQYSAQGVTKPDETVYTPTVGSTATYRAFQHAVRVFYRNNYKLSSAGAAQPTFDPGGDYPGFSAEPLVAHQVLQQQLQASPLIHVRLNLHVTAATTAGDALQSVTAIDANGVATRFTAKYFLDATDLGDLTDMAGVEYVIGAEARADTREPKAADVAHPDWIQPITMVVALERRPDGEDHTIPRPENYDALKSQQSYTIIDGYIKKMFAQPVDMWGYRRYMRASNFNDPTFFCDLSMLNMGANDYQEATLPSGGSARDQQIIEEARQASLGYVYWLQTELPRDDGSRLGYPNLKVRPDQFGTSDGTSAQPYIRESRRIKALYTIVQQDLDQSFNPGPRAKNYDDSCGIGDYGALDIHALRGVGMSGDWIPIKPFEIPLRALIPIRVTNFLPACKNIGTTHITNGAYRLHPAEWNVGEAAGMLASFALTSNVSPRGVAASKASLRAFQTELLARGVPLFWWTDIHFGDPWFTAAHLVGVAGIMSGETGTMDFQPNDPFDDAAKAAVESNLGRTLNWPATAMTRAQAAQWVVAQLRWITG